jgi:hypothetical protein
METLTAIFGHLCGQGRPFMIDGAPLPVCQRCLGLYAGAAMTAAWLLASGVWRRGLPDRRTMWVHAAMLMAAMLGGMHLLDPGPAWRLVCGLWTGHVAMLWLVGGAVELRGAVVSQRSTVVARLARPAVVLGADPIVARLARPAVVPGADPIVAPPRPCHSEGAQRQRNLAVAVAVGRCARRDSSLALGMTTTAAGPALAILAVLFSRYVHAGWYVWTAIATLGALLLAAALSAAAVMTARWIIDVTVRRPVGAE